MILFLSYRLQTFSSVFIKFISGLSNQYGLGIPPSPFPDEDAAKRYIITSLNLVIKKHVSHEQFHMYVILYL